MITRQFIGLIMTVIDYCFWRNHLVICLRALLVKEGSRDVKFGIQEPKYTETDLTKSLSQFRCHI